MTPADLLKMMPFAGPRAEIYAEPLTRTFAEFAITTPQRQSAFLANIAHESGSLRYVLEIAKGTAYEGRRDLGNTQPGDGVRFKGRGLAQVTGRSNYYECGRALGLDLIAQPELLEQPLHAARSAGWFWKAKNLARAADDELFATVCKIWNGGYNGMDERIQHYIRIRRVLGI